MKIPFESDGVNEVRRLNLARQLTTHKYTESQLNEVLAKIPEFIPPNIDIHKNIQLSRLMGLFQLYTAFKTGGQWDYKQNSKYYEAFGNFHFGMIMSRLGVPSVIAKAAAGYYQVLSDTSPLRKNEDGVDRPVWVWEPMFDPSWGDDQRDQIQIQNAYDLNFLLSLLEVEDSQVYLRLEVHENDSSNSSAR